MATTQNTRAMSKVRGLDLARLLLALLLLAGFALRMIDLDNPPLDFHPTRQYRNALVARSLYYALRPSDDSATQTEALSGRNQVAGIEPPIIESLVALGYLLAGGENLVVPRLLVSLIWVLSAWAVFAALARAAGLWSALLGAAYYLFLPFGVLASRSFQPDPLMVSLMALSVYSGLRWSEKRTWRWSLLTGAVAGLAILVKAVALYFLAGMLLALVLALVGWRAAIRNRQVWAIAGITLLPSLLYYVAKIGDTSGNYIQNWVVALLPLSYDPGFYVRWLSFTGDLFGLAPIFAGLSGAIFAKGVYRWMIVGLWAGYAAYGITLPHQTLTHNYYHLPLLLILALSLSPFLRVAVEALKARERGWRCAFAGIVVAAVAYNGWVARSTLLAEDHRAEPAYWERVGVALPENGRIIGLVQTYGHLLSYYGWRNVALWPVTSELRLAELRGNNPGEFETAFLERTAGMDYFLVTSFNQLEQQTQLNEYLYAHFAVVDEGDGYLIFDLREEG